MPDEGILTREDNEAAAAFVRDKARTNIRIFGDMLPETRAHAFAGRVGRRVHVRDKAERGAVLISLRGGKLGVNITLSVESHV